MKPQPFLVSEEILLRKLTKRDEQAFYWLYDQYAHVLYGVVLASVGQPNLASQLVEDIFVKAWADFDQYNPHNVRLLTWLLNRTRAEMTLIAPVAATGSASALRSSGGVGNLIGEEQRNLLDSVYFGRLTPAELANGNAHPATGDEPTLRHRLRVALQELKTAFTQ